MRVRSLRTSSGPGWGRRRATRPRQSSWTTQGSSAAPTTRGSSPWRRSAPTFVRMIWQMMILWSWIQANRFSCGWVLGVARSVFYLFLWFYSYCPLDLSFGSDLLWILSLGTYQLDLICWILSVGSHSLDPIRWILSVGSYPLDLFRWILSIGYNPLDIILWILFIGSHPFGSYPSLDLILFWILFFFGSYSSLDLIFLWILYFFGSYSSLDFPSLDLKSLYLKSLDSF